MVLTVASCSPRCPGLFATVIPEKLASQELDTSVGVSGPHDFAVRKSALSSAAQPASTASRPHVRDDRETPLVRSGTAGVLEVIWVKCEAEYFCKWDWTTQITLIRFKKSVFSKL